MGYKQDLQNNNQALQDNNDGFREILAAVEGLSDRDGIDTSDATAVAGDLLAGKTAYVNGEKLTGTIRTMEQAVPTVSVSDGGLITASTTQSAGYVAGGTKTATKQLPVQGAQTITPGTKEQTIPASRYLTGEQKILGDEGLVPENIAAGVSIFGVTGTLEAGSNPCLLAGTPIDMADGSVKAIEELQAGDIVQSYDPVTKTLVPAVVIRAYVTGYSRKFTAYNFANGKHLTLYGMHGFYNAASGMTKDIQNVAEEDVFVTLSGDETAWIGSREVYIAGAKKARYNLITSNNLYFANGLLLGSRPYNKLQIALDRGIPITDEIRAVWQADCDDYNRYTEFLAKPAFYAEVGEAYREFSAARHTIEKNKKRLADSDYKAQKYVEGVLSEAEWQSAKTERAAWRKAINDSEAVAADRRAKVDAVIARYRDASTSPRAIFEACCTRDNAIFEAVKAHFRGKETE